MAPIICTNITANHIDGDGINEKIWARQNRMTKSSNGGPSCNNSFSTNNNIKNNNTNSKNNNGNKNHNNNNLNATKSIFQNAEIVTTPTASFAIHTKEQHQVNLMHGINVQNHNHSNNCNINSSTNIINTNICNSNRRRSNNSVHLIPNTIPPFTSTVLFQLLCLICTCLLCYYNATECLLVFDDISAVRDNKDLRPSTPIKQIFLNDFWGTPMRKEQSHKSYRPLTVLTFRINYYIHELRPYGYHAVNVILHIIVCLLWRRVSRLVVFSCINSEVLAQKVSWLSTLLFAVHPVHTEAVTGVVGRAELLSSIMYLCAFLSYARSVSYPLRNQTSSAVTSFNNHKYSKSSSTQWCCLSWGFGSCLLASLLCKEQGITIAGVCMAYELFIVHQIQPLQLWEALLNIFEERPFSIRSNHSSSKNNSINSNSNSNSNDSSPSKCTKLSYSANSNDSFTLTFGSSTTTHRRRTRRFIPFIWSSSLVKRLSFLITITLTLLIGRLYVMGSQLPVFTHFDNPASAANTPIRQLTFSYLIFINIWLLLFPCDLCCDWTMGTVTLINDVLDMRNICTLLTFLFLILLFFRACVTHNLCHSRMLLMCLAWIVLPFLPASNLFFPVGFVVAERILYMPSMGFCLLVAYGYECLKEKCNTINDWRRIILTASMFMLLLTHGLRTHQRNYDWINEYTLFMSGLRVNNRNAKLFNNVGHALENEGHFDKALVYFQQAVRIQPDDIGAHINVGRTYSNLKLYDEAEAAYLKAKSLFPRIKPGESYQARIAPNYLNVFINLANLISRNQSRLKEADFLYRQAISMRVDYVQAYINRGDILMKMNRTVQAQEVYEKALLYDNKNADIYYNLGVVFLEQGKNAQANVYFNKALELHPEHEQALLNSAILLQEIGGVNERQLSRERLHKILHKSQDNEKVFFNLGMLAMDESDFDAAENYFKRAIHLKANFRSALFNLALLLADTNRSLDAVPYLKQLIRYHPDHIKGLILLGDIYINHMKDLDTAESCYRSILQYEPRNIQGLHNLCVVFVERKHLAKARECLHYVYTLSPKEDYILRHLRIVETRLQKISMLPDSAPEKQLAFYDYQPHEFLLPSTITNQQQFKQLKSEAFKATPPCSITSTQRLDKTTILPSEYNT